MSTQPVEKLIFDWTEIIPSFIKVPWNAFKYRYPINHYGKILYSKIKKIKTNIIILGKPLAGKTEFMNYLVGDSEDISYVKKGTSFSTEDSVFSFGQWSKVLRTVPGQKIIGKNRYSELNKSFNVGNKLEGVIYVVDYGYTDIRDDALKQKMITEKDINLEQLRKDNLAEEAKDFNEVCLKIEEAHALGFGPKWMIILANKADLFTEQFPEVQKYYSIEGDNAFAARLIELKKHLGQNYLHIHTLPICSLPENFVWGNNTQETKIGGTENRRALLKNLVFTVNFLDTITQ